MEKSISQAVSGENYHTFEIGRKYIDTPMECEGEEVEIEGHTVYVYTCPSTEVYTYADIPESLLEKIARELGKKKREILPEDVVKYLVKHGIDDKLENWIHAIGWEE